MENKRERKKGIIARFLERAAINTLKREGYIFQNKSIISEKTLSPGGETSAAIARAQTLALELKALKEKQEKGKVKKPANDAELWVGMKKKMARVPGLERKMARGYLSKQTLGMIAGAYIDDNGGLWFELKMSSNSKIDVIGGKQWDETIRNIEGDSIVLYLKRAVSGRLQFDMPNRIDDIKEPRDVLLDQKGELDAKKVLQAAGTLQANSERISDDSLMALKRMEMIKEASKENYEALAGEIKQISEKLGKLNKSFSTKGEKKEEQDETEDI
jgi:hypothetical protein